MGPLNLDDPNVAPIDFFKLDDEEVASFPTTFNGSRSLSTLPRTVRQSSQATSLRTWSVPAPLGPPPAMVTQVALSSAPMRMVLANWPELSHSATLAALTPGCMPRCRSSLTGLPRGGRTNNILVIVSQ